jgi:hypothetical protein
MHDRLAEIVGEEVIGEVTQVGNNFYDVGFGRACLEVLDRSHVEALVGRLRQALGDAVQIVDHLNLDDPGQLLRGQLDVTIRSHDDSAPYLLQITSASLVAFYEQRFLLEPGTMGDLMGTFCHGLARLVAEGEGPLRVLSGYNQLVRRYLECLDAVVQSAIAGQAIDVRPWVKELTDKLRPPWKIIPWPLRELIHPISRTASDRIAPHDRVLRRTILFAANRIDGKVVYQYVHQHNPLEEYEQVLGWMTEIHKAMLQTYPPPLYGTAVARASSVERFMDHFPGFKSIVGTPFNAKGAREEHHG